MELSLAGKVALVTGGSKGIGRAIAQAFAGAGATVVISSRKAEDLEQTAKEIAAETGATMDFVAANAGDPEAAEATVATVMERHGRIDILVNNAATNPYMGPLLGIDASRMTKTHQVNQQAIVIWTAQVWNAWMKDNGGSVINISSVGGLSVERTIGYYNATKAAVLHLTRSLAAEMAPGVRVNAILPGLVKTDMARALWEANEQAIASHTPLKRLGEPADIGNAALFLASDAASWITGAQLIVDGGAMLRS